MSTFAVLKENVSLELGLDETASGDEDNLLGRRLNQAVREVLKETQCYVKTGTISLSADDDEYELDTALSDDPIAIKTIINSDNGPLRRVSVEEIHELRRGTNPTGTNVYRYAVDGANLLLVYPTPGEASDLTAYYVPKPTEMSSASHDPSATTYGGIPVEYHDLIEYWALCRMASYDDDASSAMGEYYRQRFEEGVARARGDMRRRGGRTLGPARIGQRHKIPHQPDQDRFYS